uniref:Proteasome subunit beta n=1 Tax=Phallusia mammillata TaxID=59560 RepID=A0A6F9DP64_9ASCI|nr:proteasome subunit beta type-4-like [Phallusia mammillata]
MQPSQANQCEAERTVCQTSDERKRTQAPSVTGTSVLGLKFEGGVMLAADTLGSYGSMARFRNVSRIMKVNDCTVLSAAGDYADYQFIKAELEQMVIDDEVLNDGFYMSPAAVHSWVTRYLYFRRSKFNPLWNTVIVAGFDDGKAFLGSVDKIGIAFEAPSVACGFGAYLGQPLLRKALEDNNNTLTAEKAKSILEDCLKVLYYRDARSYNRYEIAIVTKDGVVIEKPKSSPTNWEIAHLVKGFE